MTFLEVVKKMRQNLKTKSKHKFTYKPLTSDISNLAGRQLGLIFAEKVPLVSQSSYPIIVYSVSKYRPHLSHFWENVIFAIPT